MEIHPACLKDNEEYIIQKKYNDDNILVYKGIRKVTSLDIINPEGLYEKVHFVFFGTDNDGGHTYFLWQCKTSKIKGWLQLRFLIHISKRL